MEKTRHTPGPWTYLPEGPKELPDDCRSPGYVQILAGDGFYGISSDEDHGFALTGYVSDANARLISAAPDLLAALKALTDDVLGMFAFEISMREAAGNTNVNILNERIAQARVAIAKAE